MSQDRIDDFLQKVKESRLSKNEEEWVAESTRTLLDELYTRVHILGLTGKIEFKPLLESFLEFKYDTMLAALSVSLLCSVFSGFEEHRDRMVMYLKGVEWDADRDVMLKTISQAGEHLRTHQDQEIARLVYGCLSSESGSVREAAYSAMLRALGIEWTEIPLPSLKYKLKVEQDVIYSYVKKFNLQ